MFPTVRVDSRTAEAYEPLGTKSKFWYRDGERRMLFKAEERGTGEDWAEKVACELCELLGLPHVHYEMAFDEGADKPGVICETCVAPPLALAHGNQLLLAADPAYPAEGTKYKVRAHTIEAVYDLVRVLHPPPREWCDGLPEGITSAREIYAGYLMLDAWIANQDRHHENWGAIWDGRGLQLAPTFDHGASLARNLSDEEREDRLTTRDRGRTVGAFAKRAKSAFYASPEDRRPLSTIAAWRAFSDVLPAAERIWPERLAAIEPAAVAQILEQVPPDRMSAVCREFTLQLLEENRRRLLAREEE